MRQDGGAFARCPSCGRRVLSSEGCAEHGRSPGDHDASSNFEDLRAPVVPGYSIQRALGRGGFGTVFEARRLGDGARVALKVSSPDRIEAVLRLRREVAILADVGAPHVPAVLGSGELDDGSAYVAMALLEAPTLAARMLPAGGPLPETQIAAIAAGVLKPLEAIHDRGFMHLDLKPENIFIDAEDHATIIDFGIALPVQRIPFLKEVTAEDAVLGTPEYMAPEQFDGRRGIDLRADIYAVGVILYELATGHPPFWGPRAVVQEGHRSRRPARLATSAAVTPALDEVVLRCLAKAPEDRFASVPLLREALNRALSGGGAAAEAPRSTPSPTPRRALAAARAPAPAPAARAARQEVRSAVLIFFQSTAGATAVRDRLTALGGHLAYSSGSRFVGAYDHESGENPVVPAMRAAEALVRDGICQKAIVDLSSVSVQTRPDGSKRFLSMLFSRPERYPTAERPEGVSLTPAAAEVLPSADAALLDERSTVVSSRPVEPALVGRDAELDALLASARSAIEHGLPTLTMLIAEAGYGKSHLVRVLCTELRARHPGAQVIDLRAQDPSLGGADQILRDLSLRALELEGTGLDASVPLGDERARRERAQVPPALAVVLGWTRASDASELHALEAAPGALRSALIKAVGEVVRAAAARAPLFIVVDDAHFAGEGVLAALEYAALSEARASLWVCAAGRPSLEEGNGTWGDRAARRETHRLGPLDPESASALCRRLLLPVETVPEAAVQRLVERARAVPLLLLELVRGLKRERLVRKQPGSEVFYLATDEIERLPELPVVEWFAKRQMALLAPSLQAHAQLIALLGAEVTPGEIEGALDHLDRHGIAGEFTLDAKVGTNRLLAAGVLVRVSGRGVGFRNALVRDAFAQAVPAAQRKELHLGICRYYQDRRAIEGDRWAPHVAFHAARAGLGDVAQDIYWRLAEQSRARHDYVDAELLYSRALEQPFAARDPRRVQAHRGRGTMRYRIGRCQDALADFEVARETATELDDRTMVAELLLDEAMALEWLTEIAASQSKAEAAAPLVAELGSAALEARLLLALGRSRNHAGQVDEARELLERAAALAARVGDEAYETLVVALLILGFIHMMAYRLRAADEVLARAIALCEEHGDSLHLMPSIMHRGLVRGYQRDKDGLLADMGRVMSMARQIGNPTMEQLAAYNLGDMLYSMGEIEDALPHVERAVALNAKGSTGSRKAYFELLYARVQFYRGDQEAAGRALERAAAETAQLTAAGHLSADISLFQSMLDLALRDGDAAAWDALEALSATSGLDDIHIELLECRAIADGRRGRAAAARRQLEKALAAAERVPTSMTQRLRRRLDEMELPPRPHS